MGYYGQTERLDYKFEFLTPAEYESVIDEFRGYLPDDAQVIVAEYECECYDGWGYVLYLSGGKLYEVFGSHCSCNDLSDQWDPEETTAKAIMMRNGYTRAYGLDQDFVKYRVEAWQKSLTKVPEVTKALQDHPLSDLFIVGLDGTVKAA